MAVSKTISFVHPSDGSARTFSLTVEEVSYSIENNTSNLKWTLSITGNNSYKLDSYAKATVNGQVVYNTTASWDTHAFPAANGSVSGFINNVPHDAEGKKTISLAVEGYSYQYATYSASGSLALTNIPRASNPSCITTPTTTENIGDVGSTVRVYTNRYVNTFTHKLYYSFADITDQLIAENISEYYDWTIPTSLANKVPNATQGSGTLTLKTYNGNDLIGTKTISFTTTIPSSYKPTISSKSLSEGNSVISALNFGVFLNTKSYPVLNVTCAGSYGSTIKSYILTMEGNTYTFNTLTELNNTLKSLRMSAGNNKTYTVKVKDSRGRESEVSSGTYTVKSYSDPNIAAFTVARCLQDGTLSDDGTYLKITFNGSITDINSLNLCTVKFGYKLKTDSTYTYTNYITDSDSVFAADYTGANAKIIGGGNISTNNSYDVQAFISDSLSENTRTSTISTGYDIMHFNPSGKSIAFGKKSEASSSQSLMEVAMDMKIDNKYVEVPNGFRGKRLNGNHGTSGYMHVCDIVSTSSYLNQFMLFEVLQRSRRGQVAICLKSESTAGAITGVTTSYHTGNINVYYKVANNKCSIYVQKSEAYDDIEIVNLLKGAYMNATTFEWKNTVVASLPSGYVTIPLMDYESAPVGGIMGYGGDTEPNDWLICDGRAVSRTTYAELFVAIGTLWGAGDGSTTFNLPNLKGRTLVGKDSSITDFNTVGKTGGEKTHTLTESELPAHKHSMTSYYDDANYNHGTIPSNEGRYSIPYDGGNTTRTQYTNNTGSGQAHNNMPPYGIGNYIIKYTSTKSIMTETSKVVNNDSNSTVDTFSAKYIKDHFSSVSFPVGTVIAMDTTTTPASVFGGTWEKITNKFLYGVDADNKLKTTGGSSTHNHGLGAGYTMVNASGGNLWFQEKEVPGWWANGLRYVSMGNSGSTQGWGWQLGGTTDNKEVLPPWYGVYWWRKAA